MFLKLSAAAVAIVGFAAIARQPPPPRELYYKKKYPLHGVVPDGVLMHLCDIDRILVVDGVVSKHRKRLDALLGTVRAFYVGLLKKTKRAELRVIGFRLQQELKDFEAYAAYSSFIGDIMGSLQFISDDVMDHMLRV